MPIKYILTLEQIHLRKFFFFLFLFGVCNIWNNLPQPPSPQKKNPQKDFPLIGIRYHVRFNQNN